MKLLPSIPSSSPSIPSTNSSHQQQSVVMVASGGALEHSRAWREIICNAIRLPMRMYDMHETTSRGVAVMLAEIVKGISVVDNNR